MVLNAVQNAAKRKTKSINIHCNGINKTFQSHENMAEMGKIAVKKQFFGVKSE